MLDITVNHERIPRLPFSLFQMERLTSITLSSHVERKRTFMRVAIKPNILKGIQISIYSRNGFFIRVKKRTQGSEEALFRVEGKNRINVFAILTDSVAVGFGGLYKETYLTITFIDNTKCKNDELVTVRIVQKPSSGCPAY